jgi:NAD(P)-dependent dehydrogenase (short-subunit alcohol dehydrogenase family)
VGRCEQPTTPSRIAFITICHVIVQVLDVNLKSVWLLSQAAGRHMVPLRRGKIINVCSLLTFQGGMTVPAYAASKGALGQLTKALSNEWSPHNVQVNAICPGYVVTDMCVSLVILSSSAVDLVCLSHSLGDLCYWNSANRKPLSSFHPHPLTCQI